jgi:hypothetical protein
VTLDDIANFCEVKDCRVRLGDPEVGYITIDGTGVVTRENNYRRFLAFRELASLPAPQRVLTAATSFVIQGPEGQRTLSREEFEAELRRLEELLYA